MPFPRNRKLSEVFYRLGLVEAYGTGIPRVMRLYAESPRKPILEEGRNVFRVTLFPLKQEPGKSGRSGKEFTRKEFEAENKVSKSKATMMLNRMISEGSVIREGNGKSTTYRRV